MLRCTPFLLFDGNCAEAMRFYHECLGGTLVLTPLGDTPMKAQFPATKHGRIINAVLKSGLIEISATDWMAAPALEPVLGNMSALYITGSDGAELRPVFDKLAVGAQRPGFQDLHAMPFGTFGQLYDKYGTQWIFSRRVAVGAGWHRSHNIRRMVLDELSSLREPAHSRRQPSWWKHQAPLHA